MRSAATAILLVSVGVAVGWVAASRRAVEPSAETADVREDIDALREELRRASHASVVAARSDAPTTSSGATAGSTVAPAIGDDEEAGEAASEEEPELDATSVEAFEEATRIVDDALRGGELTDDDGIRLRQALGRIRDRDTHRVLTHRIIQAVNEGELTLASGASPL